jgi:hypothetical protein
VNVFEAEREAIAGKLTAGGVANVTLDPRGQLPCVLVGLPRVIGPQGVGGWGCEFPVEILTPPPGDRDAAGWLLDQLEAVLATFHGVPAEPTTVTRNDQDVPCYVVTLPRSLTSPNC